MLNKNQIKLIDKIVKKYKLNLVILFGSRAKNQKREDSDYDIAIYSKKNIKRDKFWKILEDIEGVYFPKVDLILINDEIDPLLSKNIFENGVCLFDDENLFSKMQVDAIFDYIDYLPLYKIEEEIVRKKLENL